MIAENSGKSRVQSDANRAQGIAQKTASLSSAAMAWQDLFAPAPMRCALSPQAGAFRLLCSRAAARRAFANYAGTEPRTPGGGMGTLKLVMSKHKFLAGLKG